MMETQTAYKIAASSPAKLNLTFDIVGGLPDGYHEVVTILQAIDLEDQLLFEFVPADEFRVDIEINYVGDPGNIPTDDSNLVAKALNLFHDHVSADPNYAIKVTMEKRIPITAGMGGGSGNAAAALLAMNNRFGHAVPEVDMHSLAARLGADVPFFLQGGTQIGLKRGDMLSPTPLCGTFHFVIARPHGLSIATTWIYEAYDRYIETASNKENLEHPDLFRCKDALADHDLYLAQTAFGNVFEPVVFSKFPGLSLVRDRLLDLGCLSAHLTGSGPTMYGLAPDKETAHKVVKALYVDQTKRHQRWRRESALKLDLWASESVDHGARIMFVKQN